MLYRLHLVSSGSTTIHLSSRLSTETFDKFRTIKMPALPQFDYLFAIGTIFAFLDAWNIGTLLLPTAP
jgi:hypothetical protein